ncbi:ATP-binding protein [Candidatus Marimicrobium litorale]|uniref:histidine kinase n=1 Tax=Candidatus Marimicrobium litorale TaxID=2518991 RepID=A0ABT3TA34_9GAMM|nr:ATP-binding protein [Candidatus Marimicrobium litorale]MCX2978695.1 PAS domain S-box protein [Candidatus Marimicrobium litorale]
MQNDDSGAPPDSWNQLKHSDNYSELLLKSVLDTVGEAIIAADNSGSIIMANQAAADMWGHHIDELQGMSLVELMPESYRDAHVAGMARYLTSGNPKVLNKRIELEGLHANNTTFPVELLIRENDFGQHKIFTAALRDISHRRKKERGLLHAHRLEVVEQLSGGVAHDFNNLLSVVMGNLHFIREEIADESHEVAEFLEDALSAAQDVANLTERLLAFSSSETLNSEVIELSSVLTPTIHFISKNICSSVTLRSELSPTSCYVDIDTAQLENALVNLAMNAREAMPNGGDIVVTVERHNQGDSPPPASDSDEGRQHVGDYIKISVSDTGEGIKKEQLSKIFEPFFTTKGIGKGSGLGLSMVYGFTKNSGGKCTVDSEHGRGTTVSMYFPEAEPLKDVDHRPDREAVLPDSSKTIVVVEGDPRVRRVTVRDLRNLGYKTLAADGSDKAIELIRSQENIDLLYGDVQMRGAFDAKQLVSWVEENHPDMHIILSSGSTKGLDSLMEKHSSYQVIKKPYTIEALSKLISASFLKKC